MPTAVDTARYDVLHATKEENFIDVVWIGSQSTSPYLQNLLPVLERAAMLEPRLRLKVIANFSLYSSILPIQNVEWREESEVAELSSAHIGIAPMPDTPWTRGKCALKVLQYMACRLPVVSSDAGANRDIILHDKSGLLAATDQQWIDGLISLAQSPQLRHIMGEVGLGICQKNFSLSSCATLMIDNLRALVMNKQCTSSL